MQHTAVLLTGGQVGRGLCQSNPEPDSGYCGKSRFHPGLLQQGEQSSYGSTANTGGKGGNLWPETGGLGRQGEHGWMENYSEETLGVKRGLWLNLHNRSLAGGIVG